MSKYFQQIQHALIYSICLLQLLIAGRSDRKPLNIKRIIVVPGGQLGDVVCTTPVFRAIRARYPSARIYAENISGVNEPLLADSGLVDEYLSFRGFWNTVRIIRSLHVDVAVSTSPSFYALACLFVGGVPFIVTPRVADGFCPQETRLYKLLSKVAVTVLFHMEAYAPRDRLRVLEPLGIVTVDTTKYLGFSPGAADRVTQLLVSASIPVIDYVCISAGAGNKIKQWPAERFAAVADHLARRHGLPVVIIGTRVDKEEALAMKRAMSPGTVVIDLCERLSLDELKAVIAKAYLFISVDTGPLYIAEALGVPTIDIVGPMDEHNQPPIGPHNVVVVPPGPRVPQLHILNARMYDEGEARRQVLATTVAMVTDAADILISFLT